MIEFPDGSLGTLGEGSAAFGSDSGSMLADGISLLSSMGLGMIAGLINTIAGDLTASVA